MNSSGTILLERDGPVARLSLNRAGIRNAMDIEMVRELDWNFTRLNENTDLRIILLCARGEHFSAGADLNWMRRGQEQSGDQLLAESRELAGLFRTIHSSGHVVVTAVRGKAMGGAIGLVAASDIVVVDESARFAFPEVKLGLIPATIAPYVLRKTGYSRAKELMLTGRMFSGKYAVEIGLAHMICGDGKLEETVDELLGNLLTGGPLAMKGIKSFLDELEPAADPDQLLNETAELIARFRTSEEGQEGIRAFLEKRKPGWHETT